MCAAPFAGPGGARIPDGWVRPVRRATLALQALHHPDAQERDERRRDPGEPRSSPTSAARPDGRADAAAEFHAFLDHFYRLASDAILEPRGPCRQDRRRRGHRAVLRRRSAGPARRRRHRGGDRSRRAGRPARATPSGPIPAGTAVHTGEAFVGATGPEGAVDDFTALGDAVNTTARSHLPPEPAR